MAFRFIYFNVQMKIQSKKTSDNKMYCKYNGVVKSTSKFCFVGMKYVYDEI